MTKWLLRFLILEILLSTSLSFSQINIGEVVEIKSFLSQDKIRPGDTFKVGIKVIIHKPWHINSHKPLEEFLIPTVVKLDSSPGLTYEGIHYPEGKLKHFAFSENPLSVYEDEVVFWANVKADETLKPGEIIIRGELAYQACNDATCLAPASKPFEIKALVAKPGESVTPINQELFSETEFELGELQGQRAATLDENAIARLISGQGLFIALFFIFIGGLALNLTPCVYPIIPITISFFISQASGKISKSFILASVYVLGMALTYSILGVVAAMTGGLLGASLQSPIVLIIIAGIFLLFAASMFGAFEIKVPAFLTNMAGGSRQGLLGSLIMGLTVGIVAAPCIGPFVLSLLTFVAAKADPYLGFLMFFVLSLGLGLPYLILGTFSGLVQNLPRSGEWLVWVKKVFGVVMVGVAVYFLSTLISETVYVILISATALLGGIYIGFIDKSRAGFKSFKILKPAVGSLLVIFSLWTVVSAARQARAPHIAWQPYEEALILKAKTQGKPVLIDFYADWCIPCKQIDKSLFSHPKIVEKANEFVALKADLTRDNSPEVKQIRKKYRVRGVPTVILLDKNGKEFRRFTDELVDMSPEEFLKILEEVSNHAKISLNEGSE
ncbi:MAG: DUF255 domain-containing protein [Calditrichaeota bacterium]|nr:MAG: DUF255 domain-containing protein [Calditrichota bacterium]